MKVRFGVGFGWLLGVSLVWPSASRAQDLSYRPTVPADASAYCDYVKGQAHSASALELTPKLFGTVGVLDGTFALSNAGNAAQAANLQYIAGATYSLTGIYRGISINQQASAECERYRRESALHAFVEMNRLGLSVGALKARLAVLDEALPRGQEILHEQQVAMTNARTTLEILEATQLRLDELRSLHALAKQNYDSLQTAPVPENKPLAQMIREHDEFEGEVERYAARVRESYGWDLSVRGGYDTIDNTATHYYFASATLTVSLGWPFQFGPDSTAIDSRRLSARRQIEGPDDRAAQLASILRAELVQEEARLHETSVLLADLEQRYKATSSIPGDIARRAAEALWFDLVKTKSDNEYYRVHVQDLRVALGDQASAP